jgi:hypothetical protein
MNDAKQETGKAPAAGGAAGSIQEQRAPKIHWDDREMRTTYANAVNAVGTMEEIAIFFGVNKSWNPTEGDLEIALSDRIVLNPYAAKRLWTILGAVLRQYEQRFGKLHVKPSGKNGEAPA